MEQRANLSELLSRYKVDHDPQIREELVLNCVPLIHYVLGRLGISQEIGMDYEDLVSQGFMGIIDAVDRYDPAFGTQFSTYATVRIRGKVLDYLRAQDWLSRNARNRSRAIQKSISTLWESLGHAPSDEQIASNMGIEVDKVQESLIDASKVIVSLDALETESEDDEASFYESVADERQENPSEIVDEEELKRELVKALLKLSDREQLLLSLYYYEELTFKEIGQVMEITESRVCQLHARALLTLKSIFNAKSGDLLAPLMRKKQARQTVRPVSEPDSRKENSDQSIKRLTYV